MRAAFGLVGILVVLAIIILIWRMGGHPADVINAAKPAVDSARQIAGQDAQGIKAQDSIRLDPVLADGKLKYVLVDDIVPGGPMDKYFGLKRNDSILSVGPLDLCDYDGEHAKALIYEAYQRRQELTVMRNGEKTKLPQAPSSAPPKNSSPLQQQLDAIPGVR